MGHNSPTVDVLDESNRILYSTKSYDTTSATYSVASKWLSKIKQDLRKLGQFTEKTWNGVEVRTSMYDSKCLNLRLRTYILAVYIENVISGTDSDVNAHGTYLGVRFDAVI